MLNVKPAPTGVRRAVSATTGPSMAVSGDGRGRQRCAVDTSGIPGYLRYLAGIEGFRGCRGDLAGIEGISLVSRAFAGVGGISLVTRGTHW